MKWDHNMWLLKKENMVPYCFMTIMCSMHQHLPLEEVFDPTGAGDTFAGGFAGYLARTGDTSFENMKKAVIYGSTLASFCVEKFGTLNEWSKLNKQKKYSNAYSSLRA